MQLYNKRNFTAGHKPKADSLEYGELAINANALTPAIYTKTIGDEGDIVTNVTSPMIEVTYDEIKELRDNSKLIPGYKYRIIDYYCGTTQEGTCSAGHIFDIIVEAITTNELNENARAINHDGDTYFADSNLNAWELKYSLDNNGDRFLWAQTVPVSAVTITFNNTEVSSTSLNLGTTATLTATVAPSNASNKTVIWTSSDSTIASVCNGYVIAKSPGTATITAQAGDVASTCTVVVPTPPNGEFYIIPDGFYLYLNHETETSPLSISDTGGTVSKDLYLYDAYVPDANNWVNISAIEGIWYAFETKLASSDVGNNVTLYGVISDGTNRFLYEESGTIMEMPVPLTGVVEMDLSNVDIPEDIIAEPIIDNALHGVIYYMKDEFNNECPYDFKNIQFLRDKDSNLSYSILSGSTPIYTFTINDYSAMSDASLSLNNTYVHWAYNNTILPLISVADNDTQKLNNICLILKHEGGQCYNNIFMMECMNITIHSTNNYIYGNTFGPSATNNSFYCDVYSNNFGDEFINNKVKNVFSHNIIGAYCKNNSFSGFYENYVGNDFQNNICGSNCYSNIFRNYCRNNTFGTYFRYNVVGNVFSLNTFGNYCEHSTFGEYCSNNTFNDNCNCITLGDSCERIVLAANSHYSIFGNQCQYLNISSAIKGYRFANLTCGPNSTPLEIAGISNRAFETKVALNSDGELKIYCEADLIS